MLQSSDGSTLSEYESELEELEANDSLTESRLLANDAALLSQTQTPVQESEGFSTLSHEGLLPQQKLPSSGGEDTSSQLTGSKHQLTVSQKISEGPKPEMIDWEHRATLAREALKVADEQAAEQELSYRLQLKKESEASQAAEKMVRSRQ